MLDPDVRRVPDDPIDSSEDTRFCCGTVQKVAMAYVPLNSRDTVFGSDCVKVQAASPKGCIVDVIA
jgi:hypothetical protein